MRRSFYDGPLMRAAHRQGSSKLNLLDAFLYEGGDVDKRDIILTPPKEGDRALGAEIAKITMTVNKMADGRPEYAELGLDDFYVAEYPEMESLPDDEAKQKYIQFIGKLFPSVFYIRQRAAEPTVSAYWHEHFHDTDKTVLPENSTNPRNLALSEFRKRRATRAAELIGRVKAGATSLMADRRGGGLTKRRKSSKKRRRTKRRRTKRRLSKKSKKSRSKKHR